MSAPYTCISCHVAFKTPELQREHYRNDWHRYNLKRKVLDLPPVSAESFQQKVQNQKNIEQDAKQDKSMYCSKCRKSFVNEKSYENHLKSKKHKENEKNEDREERTVEQMDIEEVDSDEWEDEEIENPIAMNNCMFCLEHNKNFLKNMEHMTTVHSFFVPDIEFCCDLYGLLNYLGEKICEGFMCLWCNEKGRTFYSAEAARKHMIDKGHCRMIHEGAALAEYTDFYDYSSSYPDNENVDPDQEVSVPELDHSEFELVLPSGATIGHRSLMRYYKQHINPNSAVQLSDKTRKYFAGFRALGWPVTDPKVAAKNARDIHYMKRMQGKLSLKLGIKTNKLNRIVKKQIN